MPEERSGRWLNGRVRRFKGRERREEEKKERREEGKEEGRRKGRKGVGDNNLGVL